MKHHHFSQAHVSLRGTLLLLIIASIFWLVGRQVSTVFASSADASAVASACPTGKRCVFIPSVSKPAPPPPGDLVISGIEVSQAVQNTQNSIHLVAGRKTVLRIYAIRRDFKTTVPNVKISVTASNASGVLLSESPKAYYAALPAASTRDSYNSTYNILLPSSWLSGTINLTVKLDPDNSVSETNEGNNTITQRLVFNAVPPLQIMVVPIRYNNTANGRTYPAPTRDTISDWIMRTYPISNLELTWHAPYEFTGNLTTAADFNRLLSDITTMKATERAPAARVYYGLIPTSDGSSSWFSGGYAGLGWVGSRVAIGLDYGGQSSEIAAHEIGHNLGMWHTPCGGPASPDPSFPYSDGSIGQYGLDVTTGVIYPPSSKDVMTYCNPKWVSDYTYEKLYAGQMQGGASAASLMAPDGAQRSLLVRANISADGVDLLPAYVIPGPVTETPEAGEYLVELLDAQGQALSQTPVRAYEAIEDGDLRLTGIHAMVSLPDAPAARLRLSKDGQVLAEQALETAAQSSEAAANASIETAENGLRLRWNGAQQGAAAFETAREPLPVLVRYTTDGGSTWTTLGVDVTGSEIILPVNAPKDATYEVIPAGGR